MNPHEIIGLHSASRANAGNWDKARSGQEVSEHDRDRLLHCCRYRLHYRHTYKSKEGDLGKTATTRAI